MTKLSHDNFGISILSLVRNPEENQNKIFHLILFFPSNTDLHFIGGKPWSGEINQGRALFLFLLSASTPGSLRSYNVTEQTPRLTLILMPFSGYSRSLKFSPDRK